MILAQQPELLNCSATRKPLVSPRSTSRRIMSGFKVDAAATTEDPEDSAPTITNSDSRYSTSRFNISVLSSTHRSFFTFYRRLFPYRFLPFQVKPGTRQI